MINQKILLIGGNGYIGSNLYEHLISKGYSVDNIDLCWFGKIYEETIIDDYKNLSKDKINSYTHIILLAGHSSVSMALNNNFSCISNNVLNFVDLLEKLNDNQILLYASTCAVYGANPKLVSEIDDIQHAKNIYDYSFICREEIAKLYPNKKIVGLRFGSVNGFSKNIRNENLINSLTLTALNKKPIVVSNGEAMRSVLGINDLCRVIETIISENEIKNKLYNITSLNDKIINFAKKIQKYTNSEMIVNDSFKTDYSFNCSNELFENDYNFKFEDTTESIYEDLIKNYENIIHNIKREKIIYGS